MDNANIQLLNSGGSFSSGDIAQKLLNSGFNVNALRTNDILRKDEWLLLDKKVVEVARQRLRGITDLYTAGLTAPLPNALGTTRVEYERVGDMNAAQVSMSGIDEGNNDRLIYDLVGLPIPITFKDFNINIRALEASRKKDMPLDTTQAAYAGRKVAEQLEAMLFRGFSGVKVQNSTLYGYCTHPDRITSTFVKADWSTVVNGTNIINTTLGMMQALYNKHMYGPFVMYVPLNYFTNLGNDFKTNSDKSIISRLKEIPNLSDIRASEQLTDEIVIVQMTSDVVDLLDGIQPTTVMWSSHGGMVFNFKVLAIQVPRIKSDKLSQSGVLHYTGV